MKKQVFAAISVACVMLTGCSNDQKLIEETYAMNLNSAAMEMLAATALCESVYNITQQVWHDAIFDDYSAQTLKYLKDYDGDGKVDFNDALNNWWGDEKCISAVWSIKTAKSEVDDLMTKLSSPPEKYEAVYGTMTELYKDFTKVTSLATDPSGSYTTYTADFKQADNEFSVTYNLIKTQLPDVSYLMSSSQSE